MLIQYQGDAGGHVGLRLFPAAKEHQIARHRSGLAGLPYIDAMPDMGNPPAMQIDPLVHLKFVGDSYPGAWAQGHTLRSSPSVDGLRLVDQQTFAADGTTRVTTTLRDERGYRIEHELSWSDGGLAVRVVSRVANESTMPVTLELLTSFSIGGLTPFDPADAPGQLRVHRFRSAWSAEGRLDTQSIEQLHLERSWTGAGLFSERFGQVGTMPVRRFFPFVALEDTKAGVIWGAQLAWAGSWQMEISRQNDDVCLSGGLADREFGHWTKTLASGEQIESPPAFLSCVAGGLDELCDRLTAMQQAPVEAHPAVEQNLPIVFNEWCTTWGDPTHDKLLSFADRLAGSPVKYLVIDAGWYKPERGDWGRVHGDWTPNTKLFPGGLKATADAIRQRGLIPGLWFEMETVGDQSVAFSLVELLLQRDGLPVTVRNRRFWNLNDSRAVEYLSEKVIDLLEQCGFGYLKVDYNETLGLGCEGFGSLGEGLRQQVLGSYRFFERIRKRLPDLVIENCASGGHRLEPSMIGQTAISSFSDGHELVEIPIVAANLHRLILPRQSLIWAVLHGSDSDDRLVYSLAGTFLGRMCLSGDIIDLNAAQWQIVNEAMALYGRAAATIKHGYSRRFGDVGESWRHPSGWQSVVRTAADGQSALVVTHAFADSPADIRVPLPTGTWRVESRIAKHHSAHCCEETFYLSGMGPFTASAHLLSRR